MKVTIKEWNAVATWRWDIPEDDVCVSGKCGHNFHMHCIMEWIKQETSRGQCPMCRQRKSYFASTTQSVTNHWKCSFRMD
ncbi:Anaphase-promoting complex subunit 11 [Beauveria bassiana]|nr:Anaphase-promoting complex subunit 11 [Beauveria bassiana]